MKKTSKSRSWYQRLKVGIYSFFSFPKPIFGQNLRMTHILRYLSKSNKVTIYCPTVKEEASAPIPYREVIKHLEIKHFGFTMTQRYGLYNDLRVCRFLENEYKSGSFDILQVESSLGTFFLMGKCSFPKLGVFHTRALQEISSLVQQHLSESKVKDYLGLHYLKLYYSLCERRLARKSNLVIATSRQVKEYAIRLGASPKNVLVVKNGVDLDEYQNYSESTSKDRLRRKLGIPEDSFVFIFHGSLEFPQNIAAIRNIIKIRNIIRRHTVDKKYIFLIVGGPIQKLRSSRIDMNAGENILFTGFVEDVKPYLFSADCGLAPFPGHAKSGGRIKILEFLAAGLPVISTKAGVYGFEDLLAREPIYIISNLKEFWELLPLPKAEIDKEKLKSYDWSKIASINERALEEVLLD